MIKRIEAALGRPLGVEGRLTDLNAVPPTLIAEARTLTRGQQQVFLSYVVAPSEHAHLTRFIRACVAGPAAPETWERGRLVTLVPDGPAIVERPIMELLADLRAHAPDALGVLDPHGPYHFMRGAPAVRVDAATYRWRTPDGQQGHTIEGNRFLSTESGDWGIAARRWLATVIAFRAGDVVGDAAALLRAAAPDATAFSEDARVAAEALVRLRAQAPGSLGPDAWYR